METDVDELFQRAFLQRRGPMPGYGRGPGKPWAGIVERTPCLWVVWVVAAAKDTQVNPTDLRITFYGQALTMASVALTYGTRYYWLCPICGRRCEAVYAAGRVGCRKCLRLGYQSQCYSLNSPFRVLDRLLDRRAYGLPRRYDPAGRLDERELVAALRGRIEARIDEVVRNIGP